MMIAQKIHAQLDLAREEAGAVHRQELAAIHSELLRPNTELIEEVRRRTVEIRATVSSVFIVPGAVEPSVALGFGRTVTRRAAKGADEAASHL